MLRLSLSDLALRIKILKVDIGKSIEDALSRALDPPSSGNIQRAVATLVEVRVASCYSPNDAIGLALLGFPGEGVDHQRRYHTYGPTSEQAPDGRPPWQIPFDFGCAQVS